MRLHAMDHLDRFPVSDLDYRTREILRDALVGERRLLNGFAEEEDFEHWIAECDRYIAMIDGQAEKDFAYRTFGVRL